MNVKNIRDHAGKSWDILSNAAGAREQVTALLMAIGLFLFLAGLFCIVLVHVLQVGDYGALQLQRRFYVIVTLWFLISFLLALVAVRLSLTLSERIAGPIRRMERFLDRALENRDTAIILRENDALYGIAQKINRLIESRKNIPR
jgi:methyl-accepting chemotaxis protein